MKYTDIHAHIIPDVDDGSLDWETSFEMLDIAYNEGIRRMIATPHFGLRNMGYNAEKAVEYFEILKEECRKRYPDMELYMGNEVYFDMGAMSGLKDGYACTLADSDYVLTEFPFESDFDYIEHGVRQLVMEGYIPIIAHVERYKRAIRNVERLRLLVQNGALIQMNADTVAAQTLSFFGSRAWAVKMLKADLIHFVATDTHDDENRPPLINEAAEKLIEIVGERKARQLLSENSDWIFE